MGTIQVGFRDVNVQRRAHGGDPLFLHPRRPPFLGFVVAIEEALVDRLYVDASDVTATSAGAGFIWIMERSVAGTTYTAIWKMRLCF